MKIRTKLKKFTNWGLLSPHYEGEPLFPSSDDKLMTFVMCISLPLNLRSIDTLHRFKKELGKYFIDKYAYKIYSYICISSVNNGVNFLTVSILYNSCTEFFS